MPRGPNGEIRPANVIGNAVKVAKLATAQISEKDDKDITKDPVAQRLGQKGGQARNVALSKDRREEIARHAAQARWHRHTD